MLLRNGEIERPHPALIESFRKNAGWQRGYRGDPNCFADIDFVGYRKRAATPPLDADEVLAESIRTRVSELNELLAEAAKRDIRTKISTAELSLVFGGEREKAARITVDLSKVL